MPVLDIIFEAITEAVATFFRRKKKDRSSEKSDKDPQEKKS